MSNLAYHPKGLKVKVRLSRTGTNYPSSGVTTSDFGQLPLESTIVHPASRVCRRKVGLPQKSPFGQGLHSSLIFAPTAAFACLYWSMVVPTQCVRLELKAVAFSP